MLTKELAIFEFEGDRLKPDRLVRGRDRQYLGYAEQMLAIYAGGVGKTRGELHAAIERIFEDEPNCPPQRIGAFCRLLDEDGIAKYDTDRRGAAAALRSRVFTLAAPYHPLVGQRDKLFDHDEVETKRLIAGELGREAWSEIEAGMFADVFENNRLRVFAGYPSPEALLSRYNVAQVQVALFYATRLVIHARADFRRIITHAKLARLLHDIRASADPVTNGYTIILNGPASVLRETRRYGAEMARFIPALVSCRDWRLEAELRVRKWGPPARLELSSESGLKSEMPPPQEYDSSVEAAFAKKWGADPRDGWVLKRETRILQRQQTVFVPDFTLRHESGREALLEIVGFWTPEYLAAKLEKLRLFADEHILLAAPEHAGHGGEALPADVIRYKTGLKPEDVLARLASR